MKRSRRFAGAAGWRRAARCVLCSIALSSFSSAGVAQSDPASAAAPNAIGAFPKKLTLTVVADERVLSTFQQRVASWFDDGTEVSVTATSEVDEAQLLASDPQEVRAFIVPLSAERALLTFSSVTPPAAARHLVREIRLREGFDELGLERLASVTHSAFVALKEGSEGVPREQAERELDAAGVARGAAAALGVPAAPMPLVPAPMPLAPAPVVPPALATPPALPSRSSERSVSGQSPPRPVKRASLLMAAGYGVRLRGPEGLGHGPSLALGVQLFGARTAFDLQLSGQYLFRSEFDAKPFSASVQTTALRVQVGIEPRLRSSLFGQLLLGVGADVARISAGLASSSIEGALFVPRANGTQWRSAGELTLGLLRRGESLDVGVFLQAIIAFEDVRYSAATTAGEALLARPWPVQPALSVQGRFRSAL